VDIDIKGRQVELTDAVEAGIHQRLEHLADRFTFVQAASVVVSKQRNWHSTELTLQIKHQVMRAEERSNDLMSSIDNAFEKIERQLHRHKGRLLHRSHAKDVREAPPLSAFEALEPEEEYQAPKVVRVKTISPKPMAVEEAALQMELLGHDFYVFTNDQSNQMNVIYRRRNGDIGLIQPEDQAGR